MNELIKISTNKQDGKQTVLGRDLHTALKVETRYNDWFERMCEYGFEEGKDYYSILSNRSDGLPGKPRTDHQLTLDMAKEICMLQRSEKGRQFRQYFIEAEAAYRQVLIAEKKKRDGLRGIVFRDEIRNAELIAKKWAVPIGIAYSKAIADAERITGSDFSSYKALLPAKPDDVPVHTYNATQIGEKLGGLSAKKTNELLYSAGLQAKIDGEWRLTDDGKKYAGEYPYTRNGHSGYEIRWSESVVDYLRAVCHDELALMEV